MAIVTLYYDSNYDVYESETKGTTKFFIEITDIKTILDLPEDEYIDAYDTLGNHFGSIMVKNNKIIFDTIWFN